MSGISPREKVILLLTAVCLTLCGGTFLTRDLREPVCAAAAEGIVPTAAEDDAEQSEYPDSLLPGERIDLNTAPPRDLARLPGIGEKRAAEICRRREEEGPFERVEDIVSVHGIGEATLEALESYLTVS